MNGWVIKRILQRMRMYSAGRGAAGRLIRWVVVAWVLAGWVGPAAAELTVYYVRHGQGGHNISARYLWRHVPPSQWIHWAGKIGNPNVFTPMGEEQVIGLTTNLAAFTFDVIAVSPMWRARHTILPYLKASGRSAEIWPELTESNFPGDPFAALTEQAESNLWAGADDLQVPEGEQAYFHLRPDDAGRRLLAIHTPAEAGALAHRVESMLCERFGTNDVRVLLVGHSYAGHALLRSLIGDPAAEFKLLGNTYMWKVTRAPDGVFRVHYNDRSPAQAAAAEASR